MEKIKLNNNKLISFSALLFFVLLSFSFLTGCNQNETGRQINPDNTPPEMPSDSDDPISTPPDSNPTDGDGSDGGSGGGGTVGGGGGVPPMDDPTPPDTGTGEIRGSVVSLIDGPLNGVHVRAINIDDTNVQISSFSGIDTDLMLVDGAFSIQNVPPGTYRVLIERLDGDPAAFTPGRFSIFILDEATTTIFPDEYWNDAGESAIDDPMDFETVVVTNGMTVNGIDFITNDTP